MPDATPRTTAIVDGTRTLAIGGDLTGSLGATTAHQGDVAVINDASEHPMETSPVGRRVTESLLAAHRAGALYGVVVTPGGSLQFVNDGADALDVAATR